VRFLDPGICKNTICYSGSSQGNTCLFSISPEPIPKTLDDLGRFDLKMYCNCPIRIEIITGSHIFILFLPWVVTLCLHFTSRYRSWYNIRHIVPNRGKNNINIWLPVIISYFKQLSFIYTVVKIKRSLMLSNR
jgi:hypothetical protein